MNKLAFAVTDLSASQLSCMLLRNIANFMTKHYDTDIIVFYENLEIPCMPPACAVMQIHEAFSYDGPLVATSLSTAEKLIRFPGPRQRAFYVWDLEWIRLQHKSYESLRDIYASPELTLFARGHDHAQLIEDVWNRKVAAVVEDFNLHEILTVITGSSPAGISN